MIGIIDYDAGNIRSLVGALDELGLAWKMIGSAAELKAHAAEADSRLILPGVGAFGAAMDSLRQRGLLEPIRDWLRADRKFLGICLGLQLLYDGSAESPGVEGIGFLSGRCAKFDNNLKVPAIGWNLVSPVIQGDAAVKSPFAAMGGQPDWFYFVHSYYAPLNSECVAAWADYGIRFPAAIQKGQVFACQFHPEKSSKAGLALLKGWIDA
jgi:imidazole glycerol phosphate synthase glutamine amidotransferase subunit